MNFASAVAFHFCLNLPAAFTQPGQSLLADPCTRDGYDNLLPHCEPHAFAQMLCLSLASESFISSAWSVYRNWLSAVPRFCEIRWKSCVLLLAAGRRKQLFLLIFTEPILNRTLSHPCTRNWDVRMEGNRIEKGPSIPSNVHLFFQRWRRRNSGKVRR